MQNAEPRTVTQLHHAVPERYRFRKTLVPWTVVFCTRPCRFSLHCGQPDNANHTAALVVQRREPDQPSWINHPGLGAAIFLGKNGGRELKSIISFQNSSCGLYRIDYD